MTPPVFEIQKQLLQAVETERPVIPLRREPLATTRVPTKATPRPTIGPAFQYEKFHWGGSKGPKGKLK